MHIDRQRAIDLTVLVVVSSAIFLFFQPWNQPEVRDKSIWDYIAQVIADGGVPYRDAIEIKTPLSAFLGAAAIKIGRVAGIADVFSIRILYFAIAVTLVVAIFDLGTLLFNRGTGLVAALLVAGIDPLGEWAGSGIQPKVPFMLFGVLALTSALRKRAVLAGVLTALSALCWQPGCVFLLPAAIALLPDWRKLAKLSLGFALPCILCVGYFAAAGALDDFYQWTVAFPFGPYVVKYVRSFRSIRDTAWRLLQMYYSREIPLLAISILGVVMAVVSTAMSRASDRYRTLLVAFIPLAIFVGLTALNLQGESDLFPILPFAFVFGASAIDWTLSRLLPSAAAPIAGLVLCTAWSCSDAITYRLPSTLQDEIDALAPVARAIGDGDRVYVHGDLQLLVLFNLHNSSPYLFLDRGKDTFLDHLEPDGFLRFLDRLEASHPKVVVLGRRGMIDRGQDLIDRVRSGYDFDHRVQLHYGRDGRFDYALRVYRRKGTPPLAAAEAHRGDDAD